MSESLPNSNPKNLFGQLIGVLGLLGAVLFFAGWIYRWAYFTYFQIDIGTLDLPLQSFLIVPIQVFLGNNAEILRSLILFVFAACTIYATLWLLRSVTLSTERRFGADPYPILPPARRRQSWLARLWKILVESNPIQRDSLKLLESFLKEIVIVAWILVFLFWYAQWRGVMDAERDAHHCTSTLPAVALVAPIEKIPVTRQLGNVDLLPSLDRFGIIGDWQLFDDLRLETANRTNPKVPPRVWRLLLEYGRWIYVFPALPPNTNSELRPPVLAIQQGLGDQLMILRPENPGIECSG
jgi:hypothetical protein